MLRTNYLFSFRIKSLFKSIVTKLTKAFCIMFFIWMASGKLRFLIVKAFSPVFFYMRPLSSQKQVSNVIVFFVSVFMVNYFFWAKFSFNFLFHYNSVFKFPNAGCGSNKDISLVGFPGEISFFKFTHSFGIDVSF